MIDIKKIKEVFNKKNYVFFEKGQFNLNIIGIRNNIIGESITNKFDDILVVYYKDNLNRSIIKEYSITTDPGSYWMKHPLNKNGTAILVPGQYKGAYKIGYHQGKYKALVQQKPVTVYRDNNLDEKYDYDPKTEQKGLFGINIHRSNPYSESYYIDKWSAGCQVFKKINDFDEFMNICKKSKEVWGNSFTYTLISKDDLV